MENLKKRIDEVEKESQDKDKDLEEKINGLNKLFDKHADEIEEHRKSIEGLKSSKCGQEEFDKEIYELT